MKRRQIIIGVAAILLAAAIILWRWNPAPTGLSKPIELVDIQPGEFPMGSVRNRQWLDEYQQPFVRIDYFFKMGKYEVTQRQWREVTGLSIQNQRNLAQAQWAGQPGSWQNLSIGQRFIKQAEYIVKSPFTSIKNVFRNGVWKTLRWLIFGSEKWPLHGKGDHYPVYYVNWDEASLFCERLTQFEREAGRLPPGHAYRLPSEAEWEYAASGGKTSRGYLFSGSNNLGEVAWYGDNSGDMTHPPGQKKANEIGLHDMSGNVDEWCQDLKTVTNPEGKSFRARATRGGSWDSNLHDCLSITSNATPQEVTSRNLGFRVVLAPVRAEEAEAGK